MRRGVSLLTALVLCVSAQADSFGPFEVADASPLNEYWLNPGFYSWHFQREKGLNNNNYGLGIEYRYSTANSVTAGAFRNSDRQISRYAGWYWQPLMLGPVRLGAVFGGFDGYPHMRNGGWFLAAIPVASYEQGRFGLNVSYVPSYQDRLYGAISFQLKVRVD